VLTVLTTTHRLGQLDRLRRAPINGGHSCKHMQRIICCAANFLIRSIIGSQDVLGASFSPVGYVWGLNGNMTASSMNFTIIILHALTHDYQEKQIRD
jgi:hypothetical protein